MGRVGRREFRRHGQLERRRDAQRQQCPGGFGNSIGSSAATVTLDGNQTLGGLTFSNTAGGSYTLSRSSGDSSSTLTLNGGGFGAPVTVTGGNHSIAAPSRWPTT